MGMKVVDLFSGCGGMSLGFSEAGYEIAAAFEFWDAAIKCYNCDFPSHMCQKQDLSEVSEAVAKIKQLKPDIIVGGPPCQDFSSAGKRVEGKRAALTLSFAEIVSEVHPQFFLMENVSTAKKQYIQSSKRKTERIRIRTNRNSTRCQPLRSTTKKEKIFLHRS